VLRDNPFRDSLRPHYYISTATSKQTTDLSGQLVKSTSSCFAQVGRKKLRTHFDGFRWLKANKSILLTANVKFWIACSSDTPCNSSNLVVELAVHRPARLAPLDEGDRSRRLAGNHLFHGRDRAAHSPIPRRLRPLQRASKLRSPQIVRDIVMRQ